MEILVTKLTLRMKEACDDNGISLCSDLVQYVDKVTTHGAIPPEKVTFVKFRDFSYEREFRFLFRSNRELPDPFVLKVGSLRDISRVLLLDELNNSLRVSLK